jgi:hypothetical protein
LEIAWAFERESAFFAFGADREAFAVLFAPITRVPDFSGKRDAAEARVVLDDHFTVMLMGLVRGRRRYADAGRVSWFGKDCATTVNRSDSYA